MHAFQHQLIAIISVVTLTFLPSLAAAADGAVTVNVNMARILRINSPASTVIIGNPAIADVTIQDAQTLVLTGKNYGQTNLIILDAVGNPVADTLINVIQQEAGLVTMYMGNARSTLSCDPVCQPTLSVGDDPAYTSQTLASSSMIEASGSR
jgi:Flp pilus assembly secretin CpaC